MDIGCIIAGVILVFGLLIFIEVSEQTAHQGGGWWRGFFLPGLQLLGLAAFGVLLGVAIWCAVQK